MREIDGRVGRRPLAESIPWRCCPEVVLPASRGTSLHLQRGGAEWYTGHWRAQFDLKFDGDEPVELRCFLILDDEQITETWLYQLHPQVLAHR